MSLSDELVVVCVLRDLAHIFQWLGSFDEPQVGPLRDEPEP